MTFQLKISGSESKSVFFFFSFENEQSSLFYGSQLVGMRRKNEKRHLCEVKFRSCIVMTSQFVNHFKTEVKDDNLI